VEELAAPEVSGTRKRKRAEGVDPAQAGHCSGKENLQSAMLVCTIEAL